MKRFVRTFAFGVLLLGLATSGDAFAQTIPGGDITAPDGDTGGGGGESTTSNVSGNDGEIGDTPNVEIDVSDDVRNQGFVGPTAGTIQNGRTTEQASAFERNAGFIGSASDSSGPPLSDGGTFGGDGTNSSGGSFSGGGGAARGGGGFTGAQSGVNIVRQSLRARLAPTFYAPKIPPTQITNRFNNRLMRQPGGTMVGTGYSIQVVDRTAYINGTVPNNQESERLVRQLRLEPGIYKIVNQLQIAK